MEWARTNNFIVFTHDLDFGTALALSNSAKPSVIQVRTQNVTIAYLKKVVVETIKEYADVLDKGALVIIDEQRQRMRILPLA